MASCLIANDKHGLEALFEACAAAVMDVTNRASLEGLSSWMAVHLFFEQPLLQLRCVLKLAGGKPVHWGTRRGVHPRSKQDRHGRSTRDYERGGYVHTSLYACGN